VKELEFAKAERERLRSELAALRCEAREVVRGGCSRFG
jgi:hypothetical protein